MECWLFIILRINKNMITIKTKTQIRGQVIEVLDTIYDQIDKAILWFNGSSECELKRLYDVRDLSRVSRELVTYNSRSSTIVLNALLAELKQCPDDITTIQTKGGKKGILPDVIVDIIGIVSNVSQRFEILIADYRP